MEEKKCLECKEPLRGRIDKKFCSDACRNSFNNKKFSEGHNLIRNINRILKKNWNILSELNPNEKSTHLKKKLISHGFNFEYYTTSYTTRSGSTYYFCYDQGYLELSNEKILIVKKEHKNLP